MSPKVIFVYLVAVVVLVGIIVAIGSQSAVTAAYTKDDPKRPIAEVAKNHEDLGRMTNSDIKSVTFPIKNTGQSDLELTQVSTSCDCTYAYITINGQKSQRFTMHGTHDWVGKVPAGQQAQVEVIYEPSIMPVQGTVERVVSLATNDPNNPQVAFHLNATVQD